MARGPGVRARWAVTAGVVVAGVAVGAPARPLCEDGLVAPVVGAVVAVAVDGDALGATRLVPAVAPIVGTP